MNENIKKYNNLVEAQAIIDDYVSRFYPKKYKTREPILDGVTDVERYLNSKIKICWVLKEPYDGFKGKGGGFDLKEMLTDDVKKENHNFGKTWTPIGYISYSLLNGFLSYKQLLKLDKKVIMQSLLDISYINVGKMPAKNFTTSPYKNVKDEYKIWAPILIWQLIKYDPDLIIFGNTIDFFWNDLGLDDKNYKKYKSSPYVKKYDKMFLHVYHPAVRESTISKEKYCNDIIKAVKKEYILNKTMNILRPMVGEQNEESVKAMLEHGWSIDEIAKPLQFSEEKIIEIKNKITTLNR